MLEINNCAATITNVNPRAENHGDEITSAFDINFKILVYAECIKGLYSDDFVKTIWDQAEGKGNRFPHIAAIHLDNEFEDGKVTIKEKFGHKTVFENCKIKKFKMRPRQQQIVELWFQIQHTASEEEEILTPLRCLKIDEGVQVTVEANDLDPTKNKKEDDSQMDAFPNGKPEEDKKEDPFEGSDLEDFSEDEED